MRKMHETERQAYGNALAVQTKGVECGHTIFRRHDVPVLLLAHSRGFDAQELHTWHERRVLSGVPLLGVEAQQRAEVVVGNLEVFMQ